MFQNTSFYIDAEGMSQHFHRNQMDHILDSYVKKITKIQKGESCEDFLWDSKRFRFFAETAVESQHDWNYLDLMITHFEKMCYEPNHFSTGYTSNYYAKLHAKYVKDLKKARKELLLLSKQD